MVFSSLLFAFFFLPIVVVLYYLAKEKYRNALLVVASLLFYAYGEPKYVFVMIASILINYLLAILIENKKIKSIPMTRALLALDIFINIGMLFIFKYLNYSIIIVNKLTGIGLPQTSIPLPIGISFFTFQALSYCIDVYRGKVRAQKNIILTALYISFFPQLIAGPIVRYSSIEEQMLSRQTGLDSFSEGSRRFFLGFAKKIILANNLAVITSEVFKMDPAATNPLMLWIGSISFSLQIYYDFSGYSDMAIGLGRIFGFKFDENFNYPYIASSVTDFWRRWHISLSSWFRDYVYIPLGGSRVGALRHIMNLFIVWFLTGMWHGANITFIVWGLIYFVFLLFEKWVVKPDKRGWFIHILWRVVSLILVNFAWVIFNSENLGYSLRFILGMLGTYGTGAGPDAHVRRILTEYGLYFITGIVLATPIIKYTENRMKDNKPMARLQAVLSPLFLCFLFLWSVSFLIMGYHNPFIYFNF